MNTAQRVQVAFVGALRPFSDVRGAGRVCRLINRCFLKTGVPPIQVGQMRDGRHTEQVVDGNLVINIRIAKKYGEDIQLVCNTTGDGVDLTGKNLRIILRDGFVEVHYAFDKGPGP